MLEWPGLKRIRFSTLLSQESALAASWSHHGFIPHTDRQFRVALSNESGAGGVGLFRFLHTVPARASSRLASLQCLSLSPVFLNSVPLSVAG